MLQTDDATQVAGVIQAYVDACAKGDVQVLKNLFSETAAMNGWMAGECLQGGPQPFFDAVANNPPPFVSGADYQWQISDIKVNGNIACATVREDNYLGLAFINHFHLLRVNKHWLIVSKLFESAAS